MLLDSCQTMAGRQVDGRRPLQFSNCMQMATEGNSSGGCKRELVIPSPKTLNRFKSQSDALTAFSTNKTIKGTHTPCLTSEKLPLSIILHLPSGILVYFICILHCVCSGYICDSLVFYLIV